MKPPLRLGVALALVIGLIAAPGHASEEDPACIAFGEEVDIQQHLVAGKTVLFAFASKYCPPCQRILPRLHKLADSRDDLVVVVVEINRPGVRGIDWESPVAIQYGLQSVPHFKVFGPDGKLAADGLERMR